MGVAPAVRTSLTNWPRLVAYCARLMLAVGFWSLWPNCAIV